MMSIYWLFTLIPIVGIFFFFLNRKGRKIKNKYDLLQDVISIPSGRYGLIRLFKGTIEFREIAKSSGKNKYGNQDEWIKIHVLKVYPDTSYSESDVIKELKYDTWICNHSSDYSLSWFDDNSQRIRDEKISEILKK